MKLLFVTLLAIIGCSNAQLLSAQDKVSIPSISADALNQRIAHPDTVYIINYWSTWCLPCIKELPDFERIGRHYKDKAVKVLLVSFDFKEMYPEKLHAWVAKKKLKNEVLWLNETNPNDYIPKLNDAWTGSLPATNIRYGKSNFSFFKEESITYEELKTVVDSLLF